MPTTRLIITPTARLARAENRRIAAEHAAAGRTAWMREDVLSFAAWLTTLRDNYFLTSDDARVPIDAAQSLQLWQSIIDRDVFIGEPRVAEMAQRSWRLITEAQLQPPQHWPAVLLSEDSRSFKFWAGRYHALCTAKAFVDEWTFAGEVPQLLANGRIKVQCPIELVGFDLPLTPLQARIIAALEAAGSVVSRRVSPAKPTPLTEVLDFATPDQELRAAAQWARARLERDAAQSIAIVVPNLAGNVARCERIVRQVFDAAAFCLGDARAEAWHISLGKPLLQWPLVADAMAILELADYELSQPAAHRLLRSPFLFGWDSEAAARANVVAQLSRDAPYRLTHHELQHALRNAGAATLAAQFEHWLQVRSESRDAARPSQWAARFQRELSSLGFGSGRALNSHEYQVLQRWHDLLESFSALDLVVAAPLPRQRALALLNERARSIIFREQNPGVPVEVLGVEEALGSHFDAMWITALDNGTWPAAAQRDPLIPAPLQTQVAAATSAGRMAQAQRELNALLAAADEIRGSFSHQRDDADYLVTALLPDCATTPVVAETTPPAAVLATARADARAPALQTPAAMRGGTALLLHQSECPFRAFAEHRLHARDLTPPRPGLDARTRGNAIHNALEWFWRDVADLAALKALSDAELDARIHAAASAGLDHVTRRYRLTVTGAARAVEHTCMQRLMRRWLDEEKQRGAFEVAQREQPIPIQLAGLSLDGKIDRVDSLADGTTLLIDYKTGASTKAGWFPEPRLADPQLPAYATALQPPPHAIAFARLRPDDLGFEGIAATDIDIPGVTAIASAKGKFKDVDSWATLLGDWQHHLESLAGNFVAGDATVDPRTNNVCKRCHLHALCRIHERAPLADLSEMDADE